MELSSSRTKPATRRRAPRGTLNQDVIVRAAIAVLDADGLQALTIGRLADDLGVRPMSLYTHFRDKQAILRAVTGELYSRLELPRDTTDDIETLRQVMRAYFRLLVDNPVLLQLDAAVESIGPAEARFSDTMYGCLQRLRVDHYTAVGLIATLLRFVIGSATVYPIRKAWDDDPDHWERQRQLWAKLPPQTYPSMHDLTLDFPAFTQLEVFEFGLQTLLTAVASAAGQVGGDEQDD